MKTITAHAAIDLRLEGHAAPIPGPNEVLFRLETDGICRLETGGICESDLHYYNHGGFGLVRLKEPMILGHEGAGASSASGTTKKG